MAPKPNLRLGALPPLYQVGLATWYLPKDSIYEEPPGGMHLQRRPDDPATASLFELAALVCSFECLGQAKVEHVWRLHQDEYMQGS